MTIHGGDLAQLVGAIGAIAGVLILAGRAILAVERSIPVDSGPRGLGRGPFVDRKPPNDPTVVEGAAALVYAERRYSALLKARMKNPGNVALQEATRQWGQAVSAMQAAKVFKGRIDKRSVLEYDSRHPWLIDRIFKEVSHES